MPTYEYRCKSCEHQFDAVQAFSDNNLTVCPECSGVLKKVFGNVGITFKGSGFYKTDSRSAGTSDSAKDAAKTDAKKASDTSSSSADSTSKSSDTKSSDTKSTDKKPAATPSSDKGSSGNGSSSSGSSPAKASTAAGKS